MSLDLGALVGEVILETATFDRTYIRVVRQMADIGAQAQRSAAGTATLDESFAGVGASADSAGAAVTRATRATTTSATAQERAARAATQHATAVARVSDTMAGLVGTTDREQAATLRAVAAQERYDALLESGTATTRQLASAQAGLITSQRGVVAAQNATATATEKTRGSMHGLLGTVRDLGLVFGGIEIAKQAIEFVGAGRDLTTSLNGVQAASHATNGQMRAVRAQAIGLGKDMTVPAATAVDAADAIQDLVRSGMTLPRAMAAARSALLLASAAQVSTADGARYLGDILDDFGLSGDQAAHVANLLAGAATSAGGGLSDMFDAMKYAGPVARAAGVDVGQLSTMIAELAKSGIQGQQAGTGIRSMLLALAGPTKQQAEGFKALGITTKDAAGNLIPIPQLLDELHRAQDRLTRADFLAAIKHAFGKPATSVVASFAHQGIEGYDRFAARVGSGDVQKYADLMNRGVSASMKAVRKEFTAAGIDVWQKVEPAFAAVGAWLGVELPHAGHAAASVLGGPLHAAWGALGTVVGLVGDVLGPVIHLLDSPVGAASAQTVLAMWAAWKGYTIAVAAGRAIRDAMIGMEVRATNGVASFGRYGAGVRGVLSGNASQAAATSAVMQAEFADIEAAALAEAAAVDQAAADQAEAYATLVAASDDATATMIANSQNTAAAAQAQAAASAEAATTAAAAADAAAADIDAAGEAAAVGWTGILGPIGLVAVGVAAAASAFGLFGSSAKSNAADVDTLTAAIQRDNDALGANTRQTIAHTLAQNGALDAAHTLGLSLSEITDAAMQGGPVLKALTDTIALYAGTTYGSTKDTSARTAAARKLMAALGDENSSVSVAIRHAKEEAQATGGSTRASQGNTTARRANTTATTSNATSVRKLAAAEVALINVQLSQAQSQDQFLESVRATTQQLKGNNGSLSQNTAKGLANRDALLASVQAALSLKAAQDKAGGSTVAHTRTLAGNIASLRAAAIAAGADKTQVDNLLRSLHATPKQIRSSIKVDGTQAMSTIQNVHDAINNVPRHVPVSVDITVNQSVGRVVHDAVNNIPQLKAAGGPIRGAGTATSDSIPVMASNGEHMVSAREVQGLGGHGAVAAIRAAGRAGRAVLARATGGAITTGKSDGKKVWIYGGQQYASERAAENARARTSKTAATKEAKLEVEIRTKDIPGLMAALKGSTSQLIAAERTLSKAAKDAGLTTKALGRVADAEKRLNGLSRTRNSIANQLGTPTNTRQTAYERLEAAQSNYSGEKSTVASNITGGFDLSQAGRSSGTGVTIDSILGDAAQQKANAQLFNRQLDKLKSMGLGKTELQDLAEKGFAGAESSTLALLGGSRKQIRQLNGDVAGLGTAANHTGAFTAQLLYGGQVKSAQANVNRLKTREARIDARMEKIGSNIVNTIRRGLGLPVPGQHPAAHHPAHHPAHANTPTHLTVIDADGKLMGTLRVAAQHEAAKHAKATARAVQLRGGRL